MKKFKQSRFKALVNLSANFSEVFFASIVIPIIIRGIDTDGLPLLMLGLIGTVTTALLSIKFAEKGNL